MGNTEAITKNSVRTNGDSPSSTVKEAPSLLGLRNSKRREAMYSSHRVYVGELLDCGHSQKFRMHGSERHQVCDGEKTMLRTKFCLL
jgi:hypothetical protein